MCMENELSLSRNVILTECREVNRQLRSYTR
jgi:hypothetical protein